MVVGSYNFDGQSFSASAQIVDLKALKMSPEVKESGQLVKLLDVENALAWDLSRQLDLPALRIFSSLDGHPGNLLLRL